jgi:hypothetical protein
MNLYQAVTGRRLSKAPSRRTDDQMRRQSAVAAAALLGMSSLVLTLVVLGAIEGRGPANRGNGTSCTDFLNMSASERHDVIERAGYASNLTTNARQVARAMSVCRTAQNDETVGDALGP